MKKAKQTKKTLSSSAKLAHYVARERRGDVKVLGERTGYSTSHISNVKAGRRSLPDSLANEMYKISAKRDKNTDLAKVEKYW